MSHNDEIYERGVHDGQNADKMDQFSHNLSKGWHSPGDGRSTEIYNAGYDYGVAHQGDSSDEDSGGGCFISTACVSARGLPDDCHELTVLRRFRDEYIARRPGGRELINQYYTSAPGVLAALLARSDAKRVLENLYNQLVVPVVRLVEAGRHDDAINLYVRTFSGLRRRAVTKGAPKYA